MNLDSVWAICNIIEVRLTKHSDNIILYEEANKAKKYVMWMEEDSILQPPPHGPQRFTFSQNS